MDRAVGVGELAPDFDLTSTEGVILMLRDEVPRSAVILYFFADPKDEATRRDLLDLGQEQVTLKEVSASVFAISPAKLDELKETQRDLGLPFPLLRDDRGFSAAYGVQPAGEGETGDPALAVVDRDRTIVWMANPAESVAAALPEIRAALKGLPSPTANLPRKATNWLVDRWVNQTTGLRKKRA